MKSIAAQSQDEITIELLEDEISIRQVNSDGSPDDYVMVGIQSVERVVKILRAALAEWKARQE